MLIFAHDKWARFSFRRVGVQLARGWIHWANDIGVGLVSGRLVMDGPAGIALMNPLRGGLEIRSIARLVAERPDDDGRMVLIALNHANCAIHMGASPVGVPGECPLAKTHAVALDVGFIQQVKPVAVAKVI